MGAVASSIRGMFRYAGMAPSLIAVAGLVLWNSEKGGPGAPLTSDSLRKSITVATPYSTIARRPAGVRLATLSERMTMPERVVPDLVGSPPRSRVLRQSGQFRRRL